jgi:hypothetical protein
MQETKSNGRPAVADRIRAIGWQEMHWSCIGAVPEAWGRHRACARWAASIKVNSPAVAALTLGPTGIQYPVSADACRPQ